MILGFSGSIIISVTPVHSSFPRVLFHVSPPSVDEDAEDYDEDLAETVEEIRGLIEEYRAETQQTRLLTMQEDEDDEED